MAIYIKNRIGRILFSSFTALIVMTLVAASVFILMDKEQKLPRAQKGVLDLSAWDFKEDGIVKFDGQWEFYWKRFLHYEDIQNNPALRPDRLAKVPEVWNHYQINEERIPGQGFGTYRLVITLKDTNQKLSLKILPMFTAYKVYVNDQLLVSRGEVGTDRDSFRSDLQPETIEFVPPDKHFNMIVHVSNFDYAKGGMGYSILLGTSDEILKLNNRLIYKDLLFLGSLIIALFYSLSMYFMNREEKISLYFAFICMVFIVRIIITGSYFTYVYILFPSTSVALIMFLNYFISHGGALAFALMIRELFPTEFSNRARHLFIMVTAVITAFIIIVPMSVYSKFAIPSDILILSFLAYAYYVTGKAVIRKKPHSLLAFGGNGLLLFLVAIDFIHVETNRNSILGEPSTLGFFVFIFLYAFILSSKFSMSFKEVKILSRKLLELDRLKDEFLANTSHELKAPLHGIISITESLMDGVEGPLTREQMKNLHLVASSGRRLAHLIDDILDISKLKHGDILLHIKSVYVASLVEAVILVFKQMYSNKNIVWSCDIPPSLPPVLADENRLVQILYNLIGNAAKFTDSGEIKVSAAEREGMIEIQVSDTGRGIHPEKRDVIFHAFEQADSSITREYGGVGLGLSITNHLVELHGGQIKVGSELGKGSCFTVTLPVSDSNTVRDTENPSYVMPFMGNSKEDSDKQAIVVNQKGEHVLVVDDDYANRQSAINLLKLEGYSVTAVADGKHALKVIEQNPDISLVILDVMMPGISGYEVCLIIREKKSFIELPVLMVTAKHQMEDLVLGFDAGANDFLVKPFEPMEFKARVKTLIELNKAMNKAVQSEIAFLQAQIKPHFLYNTLNTISYFCSKDAEKARELLNNFSVYLRNSFDFKNLEAYVSLKKEIEFVSTYVEIEKARFGSRLHIELIVEAETMAMMIPPLILQPLVENAILHGVMKKIEGGVVEISVKRVGQELQFGVRDTGIGMSESKQQGLLFEKETRSVGLRNINMRLQNLYGKGISISSEEGNGTVVTFSIPVGGGNSK